MFKTYFNYLTLAALVFVVLWLKPVAANNLSLPAYTAAQLAELEQHGSFVLVATKAGCPVCARQVPAIQAALQDPALQQLTVLQYNQVTEKNLNKKYNVTGQSTIIVFRQGKEVSRSRGLVDEMAIKDELKKAL
ncbi:thioredoxin family protein [Arsukibacterium sp.]|uniref:thioredoxin family protein n=1 Tax=Arsukibacterium sp. TaxID=1977258 RepID=UPI002FDA8D77